jgi:hypothetical protein
LRVFVNALTPSSHGDEPSDLPTSQGLGISYKLVSMLRCVKFAVVACLLLCAGSTSAQSVDEKEHAVVELGGAGFRDITNSASSFGLDAAVEVTPVKNWLELEFGTTGLFRRHSKAWGTDLLFKKPWDLSPKVEFMLGVGPEWDHSNQYGITTNSVAAEAMADFMFWPWKKHRFGWYLEPTYEYSFARGHEQSLGATGGLLISF